MKIAFLTEMGFKGKVPSNHTNMRTEFAWMYALDADHFTLQLENDITDYDHVFIIFPKGKTYLNLEGSKLVDRLNPVSELLSSNIVGRLKERGNKKVHYIQEGPHWWFNDYELGDQINFYNFIGSCDSVFVHNEHDTVYYRGLFPGKAVNVIDTLLIEDLIEDIIPNREDKAIIGGNFARWYGGFESYIVAQNFNVPIYAQTSHATRQGENQLVNQLPRLIWLDWMKTLATFKYAVHLMPTIAAGTFSLNCAYFGIPCIGNREVNTQKLCHPFLSVDVNDIERANMLAIKLVEDRDFYAECSYTAKSNYKNHYSLDSWKDNIKRILNGN